MTVQATDIWILKHQILPNQFGLKYAALSRVLEALEADPAGATPVAQGAPESAQDSDVLREITNEIATFGDGRADLDRALAQAKKPEA